jgi:hypothetical protein
MTNDDVHMFYDPRTGQVLAIGSKDEVSLLAERYMENLAMIMEMNEQMKKEKRLLTF